MDDENFDLASGLISRTYIAQGSQALARRRKLVRTLLNQRRLPAVGWDDATIELFLQDVALMDSNNFVDNVGVGEREARVASELVARRHYRLAHGIGRSGDVSAEQPKAAGSSLLVKLTNLLTGHALEVAGMGEVGPVLVLPLSTGMAITTTLLALGAMRPPEARYVLWPRVDQKTCLKSITAAGYEVVPVAMQRAPGSDELTTDVGALGGLIEELGAGKVACIVTTTSCFAPRAPDDVVSVAKLCQAAGIPHIINNAYGVQSRALCARLASAWRRGRVDCVVQSTDKNFMVPVGGAVLAARKGNTQLVERVNSLYPGRASMAPLLDLLITLLHWGEGGWRRVLQQREELHTYALKALQGFAAEVGERVLHTPSNPISMALTLATLGGPGGLVEGRAGEPPQQAQQAEQPGAGRSAAQQGTAGAACRDGLHACPATSPYSTNTAAAPPQEVLEGGMGAALEQLPGGREGERAAAGGAASGQLPATLLGSMLFKRCVSGTRVVARGKRQTVGGVAFRGYGAHCDDYPCDYLNVAAALGTTQGDIDAFVGRTRKCLQDFRRKQRAEGCLVER